MISFCPLPHPRVLPHSTSQSLHQFYSNDTQHLPHPKIRAQINFLLQTASQTSQNHLPLPKVPDAQKPAQTHYTPALAPRRAHRSGSKHSLALRCVSARRLFALCALQAELSRVFARARPNRDKMCVFIYLRSRRQQQHLARSAIWLPSSEYCARAI